MQSKEFGRLSVVVDLIEVVLDETRISVKSIILSLLFLSSIFMAQCNALNLVADAGEDYTERCKTMYIIQDIYDQKQTSGTTTSSDTNKLIDSSATFTTSSDVNDLVYNADDETYAYINAIDSDTQLSISSDIMSSGEDYIIYDVLAYGTTTSSDTNKLIDSSATFTTSCNVGDRLHNTTDDTSAFISAIDSDTQLSISSDIMSSGEDYDILRISYGGTAIHSGTLDIEQSTPNAVIDSTGGLNGVGALSAYDRIYFNGSWHIITSFTDTQLNLLTMDEWEEPTCYIKYEFQNAIGEDTIFDAQEDQSLSVNIDDFSNGVHKNKVRAVVLGSNIIADIDSPWVSFQITKSGETGTVMVHGKFGFNSQDGGSMQRATGGTGSITY